MKKVILLLPTVLAAWCCAAVPLLAQPAAAPPAEPVAPVLQAEQERIAAEKEWALMKPAMADTVAAQQQISHTGHLLTKGGGEEVLRLRAAAVPFHVRGPGGDGERRPPHVDPPGVAVEV